MLQPRFFKLIILMLSYDNFIEAVKNFRNKFTYNIVTDKLRYGVQKRHNLNTSHGSFC